MVFSFRFFLILFLFLSETLVFGQKENNDLKQTKDTNQSDTLKINELLKSAWGNRRNNPVKSLDDSYLALQLSKKAQNHVKAIESLSYIGVVLRTAEFYDEAIVYFEDILKIAVNLNLSKEIGFAHINMGYTFLLQKKYAQAEKHLKKAASIADSTKNISLQDYSFSYLIKMYYETKRFEEALIWSKKALKPKEKTQNSIRLGVLYESYGDIYTETNNFSKALLNYKKALEIMKNDTFEFYRTSHKIAKLFYKQNLIDSAVQQAETVHNQINKLNSSGFKAIDYMNLSIEVSHLLINIYNEMKEFEKIVFYQENILLQKDKIINNKTTNEVIRANMHSRLQEEKNKNFKLEIENQNRERLIEKRRIYETASLLAIIVFAIFTFIFFKEKQKLKENNKILLKQSQELKEVSKTKDKLFTIIAHDLKNPFHALLGFVEIIRESIENDDKEILKNSIDYLAKTVSAGYTLLENLLFWSQTQKGDIQYKPGYFDVKTLLTNTLDLVSTSARQKKITFNTHLAQQNQVFADKNMVQTILRNLITNAIKFSHQKSAITIITEEDENWLKITISDKGLGISEQDIEKIFQVTKNIPTHGTLGEKGTGLGLPLCKEFVEKNKGKIGVNSKVDAGSDFWFTLPLTNTQIAF
jgi:signal transduction histidine kinase